MAEMIILTTAEAISQNHHMGLKNVFAPTQMCSMFCCGSGYRTKLQASSSTSFLFQSRSQNEIHFHFSWLRGLLAHAALCRRC
jgi:hypothetical protein